MKKRSTGRCIIALSLLAALVGCSDTKTITREPSSISSIAPGTAGFGDTIVVTGSGFNEDPLSNRIVFSPGRFSDAGARRVVVPVSGSSTELRGIVPDGSFADKVRVEDIEPLGGHLPYGVDPPAVASNSLPFSARLRPGDVGKSFFSGTEYSLSLTAGASDEDYVVVLFNSAVPPANYWTYLYSIAGNVRSPLPAASRPASSTSGRPVKAATLERAQAAGCGERARTFERRKYEDIRSLLEKSGAGSNVAVPARRAFEPAISGGRTAPQTVDFKVLVDPYESTGDPSNFTTVTAELKYTGAHTLLYVDVETPGTCLSDPEAANLGQIFDVSLYGTDRSSFGNESDINGDGKVAVLLSPVVNEMTPPGTASTTGYIAGYFLPNDLLPDYLDSRITNGMEIFYSIVPDPMGLYGNVFEKARALEVIEGVLAHEFLHMILFNYRVLIYGGGYNLAYWEEIWLQEGLAHIAEDLNGHTESNVARANLYLADPGNVTLIYGGDELEERGASFLFLRYLGDRFGGAIFKSLVQTRLLGTANVEAATGMVFKEAFADWAAACRLSGRGITDDVRFNYSSLDLQADFDPLMIVPGIITGSPMMGAIRSIAPEYFQFTIPAGETVDFPLWSEESGRLNAVGIRIR